MHSGQIHPYGLHAALIHHVEGDIARAVLDVLCAVGARRSMNPKPDGLEAVRLHRRQKRIVAVEKQRVFFSEILRNL